MASSPITSWQTDGEIMETVRDFILGSAKSLQMVTAITIMKLKDACSLEENYDQPRQHIKKQRHYFVDKGPCSKSCGSSSSHIWMLELDNKESWAPKNLCFWTVVLEKTLESLLTCKEIQPIHPKRSQSWIFIGNTDAVAETLKLWPPDVKNWLIGKDPNLGKEWRQEEKRTAEDEMVGWHHWLNAHEFEQALGVGDGHGSLTCCRPWDCRVGHDWVSELNWTDAYTHSNLHISAYLKSHTFLVSKYIFNELHANNNSIKKYQNTHSWLERIKTLQETLTFDIDFES